MQDTVALIFGILVFLTAVSLAGWELYIFTRTNDEFRWLQTRSRLRRRLIMAFLLLLVGILIVLEAAGFLTLGNLRHLVIYVSSLTALALVLLLLSVRDLGEMARAAEHQAISELKVAMEEQQKMQRRAPGDGG